MTKVTSIFRAPALPNAKQRARRYSKRLAPCCTVLRSRWCQNGVTPALPSDLQAYPWSGVEPLLLGLPTQSEGETLGRLDELARLATDTY